MQRMDQKMEPNWSPFFPDWGPILGPKMTPKRKQRGSKNQSIFKWKRRVVQQEVGLVVGGSRAPWEPPVYYYKKIVFNQLINTHIN